MGGDAQVVDRLSGRTNILIGIPTCSRRGAAWCHQNSRSCGLLSLLVAVACTEHPTAPSDSRPQMSRGGDSHNLIGSAPTEHACTFGAGYWKAHTDAWPSRFEPAAAFFDSGQS